MSATVIPRRNAATLMRPRSAGVTSIVRRAVKAEALVAATAWGVGRLDPALGVAGPGGEAASGATRAHGAILATSAASAAISRAAALCSASSNTRRPDCAASAKTTRWPMVLESTGGS